jgi:phosphate:Na+ symporter
MKKIIFIIIFLNLSAATLFAAGGGKESPSSISWGLLIITLFGGLAFFLYGMEKMSEGMKKSAGNKMRSVLASLTRNRVIGLFVGAFVTMVIQSSSATTIMLVSFVQADLMSFAQSLGVILGADIGTTVTAQLIAFKLTDYALLMVAIGFGMRMFGKNDNFRNIGDVLLGFGVLFFGMKLMSDAMEPLRTWPEFIDLMKGLENPFLGLLIGTVFTALIQSSSAFTGIVIVLAQQGLITLEAGIPLVFGARHSTGFWCQYRHLYYSRACQYRHIA